LHLEYFDNEPIGEEYPPVLLLYGNDLDETVRFRAAVEALADGSETSVRVEDLAGFSGVRGCSLVLQAGEANLGVERLQGANLAFACTRNPEGWRHVWRLLEPFVDPETAGGTNGFQWLDESAAIEWIMSRSRGW
jgi:hypothetical protein